MQATFIDHYEYIQGRMFPRYVHRDVTEADVRQKIYYGALSRYHYRNVLSISLLDPVIVLEDTLWHATIGSYKLIDNGNGTYDSFEVNEQGDTSPLKESKPFNKQELDYEIWIGRLVESGRLNG